VKDFLLEQKTEKWKERKNEKWRRFRVRPGFMLSQWDRAAMGPVGRAGAPVSWADPVAA
jgi:hypothetical protein